MAATDNPTPVQMHSTRLDHTSMDTWNHELELSFIQTHDYPSSTVEEVRHRDEFFYRVFGKESLNPEFASTRSWYSQFLEWKFRIHWRLMSQALRGLDEDSLMPQPGNLVVVYDFLTTVGVLLKARENLVLVEVVDELDNNNALKEQLDQERGIPNQVVFAAIGWLSMLYDMVCSPNPSRLEVTGFPINSPKFRDFEASKNRVIQQGFDYIDQPMHVLINKFGPLIPEAQKASSLEKSLVSYPTQQTIETRAVQVRTLLNSNQLKIDWATSLESHLQLDVNTRTLKLFKFPSFCKLIVADKEASLLSRLFDDHQAYTIDDVSRPRFRSNDYFRELLLTYHLIFQDDSELWKSFSRSGSDQNIEILPADPGEPHDPLLTRLCSPSPTSWGSWQVCKGLAIGEPANFYNTHASFPFFGARLLELQTFVQNCEAERKACSLRSPWTAPIGDDISQVCCSSAFMT
ncbi:hypothetical protein BKA61DRAFT_585093 [Leptodontidium sp. MPI-SDFR-AT-0119]|nr:hypothetical protein BKA61DRAFT_585093 [Leptodontidium sp. MPI-SDFR-AT-0119]